MTEVDAARVADALLAAVGGVGNIALLTRCWARLRFELVNPDAVDRDAVSAVPEVVLGVHQHGQFQVVLRAGLLETFAALENLLLQPRPAQDRRDEDAPYER
ncbi:PTS transporter subunit EIIB [Cellulomonas sp. SG140]|uniref:PTS transporter subunit EIIB n=1 Tax=Cellulomonas sp. SG140 TaxID=2976536 RepID=UPI0021E6FDBE|nr:PTS transporter subunit EIIB [Cellulomonas sp. SG140]